VNELFRPDNADAHLNLASTSVAVRPILKDSDWITPEASVASASPIGNRLLSVTVGLTVNESIVHLAVAFWPFPPHDDGLLRNRQKSEAAMEPTLFHRILQSVITRRLRKVTSLVGF
jgi:hypothetical protein